MGRQPTVRSGQFLGWVVALSGRLGPQALGPAQAERRTFGDSSLFDSFECCITATSSGRRLRVAGPVFARRTERPFGFPAVLLRLVNCLAPLLCILTLTLSATLKSGLRTSACRSSWKKSFPIG